MSIFNLQTLKIVALAAFGIVGFSTLLPDIISQKVAARPAFMKQYNADKYSKTELQNNCTVCHIGKGGGENTYLGEDFATVKFQFTAELRAKYPNFFNTKQRVKKSKNK